MPEDVFKRGRRGSMGLVRSDLATACLIELGQVVKLISRC